jgi:hypothetical protein
MARRILVLSVLAIAGFAVAGASGKGLGRVTLRDSSLTPTVVKIGVGSAVAWTNRGLHSHRVASTTNAWHAFVLAAGKSRALTFPKAGTYPYLVDGKRPGVVLVLQSIGATSPTTPSSGTTYHYRVTIHVTTHYERTDTSRPEDADSTDVEWQGTWPDVAVRANVYGSTITVSGVGVATGRIDATATWSHRDPRAGGPCSDTFQDSAPARLTLLGFSKPPGVHSFLSEMVTYPAEAFLLKVAKQQQGECKGYETSGPASWNLGDLGLRLQGPSGLNVEPAEDALRLHLDNDRAPVPYPIDLLAHGDSFNFETLPQTTQGPAGTEKTMGKAIVSVVFKARP